MYCPICEYKCKKNVGRYKTINYYRCVNSELHRFSISLKKIEETVSIMSIFKDGLVIIGYSFGEDITISHYTFDDIFYEVFPKIKGKKAIYNYLQELIEKYEIRLLFS